MDPLIFIEGLELGILTGGAICMRYLRREVSAEIGPQLRRVRAQLDSLESAVNLAVVMRYTEPGAGPRPATPTLQRASDDAGT